MPETDPKTMKITVEMDGKKVTYTSHNASLVLHRDVIRNYERVGSAKMHFKPGDTTLEIIAHKPIFIPEESTLPSVGEQLEDIFKPAVEEKIQKLAKESKEHRTAEDPE